MCSSGFASGAGIPRQDYAATRPGSPSPRLGGVGWACCHMYSRQPAILLKTRVRRSQKKQTLGGGCTLQSGCDTPTEQSKTPAAPDCRGAGPAAGIHWTERCQAQSHTGVFWRGAEPDDYSTRSARGSSIPNDTSRDGGLLFGQWRPSSAVLPSRIFGYFLASSLRHRRAVCRHKVANGDSTRSDERAKDAPGHTNTQPRWAFVCSPYLIINLNFNVHLMGGAKLVDVFQGARRP